MKRIKAFLLGVFEFRRAFTTHFKSWHQLNAYDAGREWAHRLTLRRFDA